MPDFIYIYTIPVTYLILETSDRRVTTRQKQGQRVSITGLPAGSALTVNHSVNQAYNKRNESKNMPNLKIQKIRYFKQINF